MGTAHTSAAQREGPQRVGEPAMQHPATRLRREREREREGVPAAASGARREGMMPAAASGNGGLGLGLGGSAGPRGAGPPHIANNTNNNNKGAESWRSEAGLAPTWPSGSLDP